MINLSGKNQTETENAGQGVYSMDKMVIDGGPFPHTPPSGPYFDPDFTKNISVITGGKAVLNCRVYNIGNRTVSIDKIVSSYIRYGFSECCWPI